MCENILLKHGLVSYINIENNHILFILLVLYDIWDITIVIFYICF